ncbi:PREDICTED: hairy/enhancer-of-split related with YRPW motif protein 1 [Nicrophorus vespilloides]|uniref:Hairy/enhancer-of-split related with YRPW motif protein 1 n=1 Tax=Nicrophorus vespilloides TaxID=110193 RepID=A0ABM1MTE7_NICVS|nr:PREDICTED: hairy/enhancer-of-split related with YRPW motif protein 1 [Nicrophorus vespilloides]
MDHLSQNPPLHWGYSGTNASSSWAPVTRAAKRPLSESDDCDDVFSEGSSKEQCTSPGDTDSCQMLSRKKRRGVIEKKRRDRINTSLSELKRLVPSAFEKQGSAKLEKAEILQMTVDHLKMIHSKGLDSFAYDPHKYAMDYHGMGFRECASEVARYLERIEGLDIQNPLRLRLTSHLQCCAAQRELATKQSSSAPWGYGAGQPPYPPPLNPPLPPSPASNHGSVHPTQSIHHQNMHDVPPHYADLSTSCAQTSVAPPELISSRLAPATSVLTPLTTTTSSALGYSPHQYPPNSFSIPAPHQNYNQSNGSSQGMKPYRPWGAEVAY